MKRDKEYSKSVKALIGSLKRKPSEKFLYFEKELVKINIFKTKASQLIEKYFD